MKKIIYLIFITLTIDMWGVTKAESNNSYPAISEMDSLIVANDTAAIRNICKIINQMNCVSRNHCLETGYIHSAIDNFNAYAVKILSDSEIGYYNSKIDTVTPFEYLYDENLEKRFLKNRGKNIGDMSSNEHFVAIHFMLMIFQPIDYMMLLKAQNRLESIDDDIIGE